jgi:uncharacterized protein YtpQ (UPF0354 family)
MTEEARNRVIEETNARIRDSATTRDALTLLFIRLIELQHPACRVEMLSEVEIKLTQADESSSTVNLHNFLIECEQDPDERLQIAKRWIRILASDDGDPELCADQIVPLVRDTAYRDCVDEHDRDLIAAYLVGDLWIIYAVDLPDSTKVLQSKQANKLGLGAEALREVSLANLVKLVTDTEISPYGRCHVLSCENLAYASSLLLIDYVWEQAALLVAGDVVVGIPARDTVIFADADDSAGLQELRQEVAYVFANGHHLISETLLRRKRRKWMVFS